MGQVTSQASSTKRKATEVVDIGQDVNSLEPSRKRIRETVLAGPEAVETFNLGAKFHQRHNHADGSIILYMPAGNRLFRVYRDLLACKSPYFKRLFDNELQSHSRKRSLADCLVVDVPVSTARNFAILLDALLDYKVTRDLMASSEATARILSSASEMEFPDIREWAVNKLESLWPDDVKSVHPTCSPFLAAKAVALARAYNIPKVLRGALYEIVRSDDFATVIHKSDEEGILSDKTDLHLLREDDVHRLITTREKLSMYWIDMFRTFPSWISPDLCSRCKKLVPEHLYDTTFFRDPILGLHLIGASSSWSTCYRYGLRKGCLVNSKGFKLNAPKSRQIARSRGISWKQSGVCIKCNACLRNALRRRQEEPWSLLHVWFDLSSASLQ